MTIRISQRAQHLFFEIIADLICAAAVIGWILTKGD